MGRSQSLPADHSTTYVAFEVGRANLGNAQRRPAMPALLARWNRKLRPQSIRFLAFARHTGNYIATTASPLSETRLRTLLEQTLASRFAVWRAFDFMSWFLPASGRLEKATDAKYRRTPGVVMDLKCSGGSPPKPANTDKVIFTDFACPRVRGVYKLDLLRAGDKTLDRRRRRGGWGAVASEMKERAGGEWTARALSTVELIARRLDETVDVRPWRFTSFGDDLHLLRG